MSRSSAGPSRRSTVFCGQRWTFSCLAINSFGGARQPEDWRKFNTQPLQSPPYFSRGISSVPMSMPKGYLERTRSNGHPVDGLICAALKGEDPPWPNTRDAEFVQTFLQRADYQGILALLN